MKKSLISEFLGTYILVFAGTGAIIIDSITGSIGHIGIALTFGMVVAVLIYSFGHISGAHFNPAVSIAFAVMKEFEWRKVFPYIVAQILGGVSASLTLLLLFGNRANLGATLPKYCEIQSFVLEFILTFILMLIISLSAIHSKAIKSFAGLSIGFTVGLEAMFGGPISGASMNPVRSFAPAVVSGNLEHLWVYLFATTLGAISSVFVYKILKE
jgi:aquaporin Z